MSESRNPVGPAALRELPSVNALIGTPALQAAIPAYGSVAVAAAARTVIERAREELQNGRGGRPVADLDGFSQQCLARLATPAPPPLRPVINATGVLLHTGMGRAPLADEALEAAVEVSRGYCSVELDLEQGERSERSQAVQSIVRELTGAEAAHVVNNNAAATGLTVAALAQNREVIVSHGELIEIGGGYRLPEVITAFGAKLRAVGTTNKTRVADYERAIGENTGAVLVVHPSNYQVTGFAERPRLEDLVALTRGRGVPLVHDVGSGALIDFVQFGCEGEPIVPESVRAGADLVLLSGDKLLGGPQCGIVVGRREFVDRVVRHPLSRAVRVDKITLAALHATLTLYRDADRAKQRIPLLKLLDTPNEEIRHRAEHLAGELGQILPGWQVTATRDEAYVGGGSLPHRSLESWSVAIAAQGGRSAGSGGRSVESLARRLRVGQPSVVGRLSKGRLLLCLHTVLGCQDAEMRGAIEAAAADAER